MDSKTVLILLALGAAAIAFGIYNYGAMPL